jgi:hypothetical protein
MAVPRDVIPEFPVNGVMAKPSSLEGFTHFKGTSAYENGAKVAKMIFDIFKTLIAVLVMKRGN